MDVLREILLPKLENVKLSAGSWMARCPAPEHEDRKASLHISRGTKHPIVLTCHAGCERDQILGAVGLTWDDLCSPREETQQQRQGEWTRHGPALAVYDYTDANGKLLFQVLRTAGKQFPQRVPDESRKTGWRWSLENTRRVLYRLPKVLEAVKNGDMVYVCEGEKDVHALESAGAIATCNPGGAGKWRPEFAECLRDAIVRVVADADKPGRAHARTVAASLEGIALAVEIVEAAGECKDAAEHLAAGRTLADFLVTKDAGDAAVPELAPDLYEFLAQQFPAEDWVIPGLLERGDRLIWTGREGLGKACSVDTPIPTPKGWTTMGALSAGDQVFAADGTPATVTFATPVMTGHECFRVSFSDGAVIVADADHQWLTETLAARERAAAQSRRSPVTRKRGTDQRHKRVHFPAVVTTREIANTLRARGGHALNHSIKTCQPLQYPAQELPVDPYLLGAWIGDGSSHGAQFSSHEDEVPHWVAEIERSGFIPTVGHGHSCPIIGITCTPGPGRRRRSFPGILRHLGLLGNKHIPESYLHASAEQRLALLQGLMDTDGWVTDEGAASGRGAGAAICEFCVTSERVARDTHELLLGFGIKVTFRSSPAVLNGREVGTRYRLSFQTDLPVFRLARKASRLTPLRTRRAKLRYITAVEPVESVPVRCIEVDHPDHLYLAGHECIATHNTVVTRQLAVGAAAGLHPFDDRLFHPAKVLFIDCENPVRKSQRRFRELEGVARHKQRPVPGGGFRIIHRPRAIDLSREEEMLWLLERVTAHKPDLLVIGPLYKLHALDINDELAARSIVTVLDEARALVDCAVIVEGHAPHADEGRTRPLRPVGSSLFMRWPEFGYGIKETPRTKDRTSTRRRVDVVAWRGPREERDWPRRLTWGREGMDWPWVPEAIEEDEKEEGFRPKVVGGGA
jgi:hypothetical protein